jgi:hypothetical protein
LVKVKQLQDLPTSEFNLPPFVQRRDDEHSQVLQAGPRASEGRRLLDSLYDVHVTLAIIGRNMRNWRISGEKTNT